MAKRRKGFSERIQDECFLLSPDIDLPQLDLWVAQTELIAKVTYSVMPGALALDPGTYQRFR